MRFLILLVLCSGCISDYRPRFFGPTGEFTPPSISDDPLFATLGPCLAGSVQITAVDAQLVGVSRGSGVVVASGSQASLVLTARHMTEGEGISSWVVRSGNKNVSARCVARGAGPLDDWALLESIGVVGTPVPVVSSVGAIGFDRAVAIGYPLGYQSPTVTVGHIQVYSPSLVRFSAPIIFGNSGGGLFVVKGGKLQLLAITVAVGASHEQAVEHMGIGVPIEQIRRQGGLR